MEWSAAHPVLSLLLILAGSALAGIGVFRVQWDPSMQGMVIQGDEDHRYYLETVDRFGTDSVTRILVQDRNLFTPEKLRSLMEMINALGDLDEIDRIESLFTVLQLNRNSVGLIEASPVVDWLPETQEDAYRIRHAALHNPILVNHLVSRDGTATVVNVYADPEQAGPRFDTAFSGKIDERIAPWSGAFRRVFQLGLPYANRMLSEGMMHDMGRLIPLSVCILLLVLGVFMRSPSGILLPVVTAGTSVLWTAGFMGAAGIPVNILTTIVPALIFVIGSTEDIHILSEYREGRRREGSAKAALAYAIEKTGTVIALTALTTFLGFFATTINKITLLKQFGMVASFGLLVNPVITCMLAPVYLRFLRPFSKTDRRGEGTDRLDTFYTWLSDVIVSLTTRHRQKILWTMIGAMLVVGAFAARIRVDNDRLGYFRESSDIVRRSRILQDELAGSQMFQLRISGGFPGAFLRPENLKQIERLQQYLKESGAFDTSFSVVDYISYLHMVMNNGNPAYYRVPDDEDVVGEYVRYMRADWPARHLTRDLSEAGITVMHSLSSSRKLQDALDALDAYIEKQMDPHLLTRVTGRSVLMNQAAQSMTLGQVQSISIILAAILLIMSVLFVNVKVGLLSLIPNLFPIALVFGIMGLAGIPLNVGTAMVAAISIGIAVDNTIHMMFRYNREVRRSNRIDTALGACIRAEIRPVLATTLGLTLGFSALGLSSFSPIAWFGLLSALVMVLAALADLLLTPALLSGTQIITLWDIAQISLKREVLETVDLFQDMKPSQIKKVVLMGRLREAGSGELIIRQGDQGDEMFLLLEGHAKVFMTDKESGKEIVLHRAGPGTVIGEIALMSSVKRTASVQADEPVTYITYNRHTIDRIKKHAPRIASQLFLNLSRVMVVRLQEQAEAQARIPHKL